MPRTLIFVLGFFVASLCAAEDDGPCKRDSKIPDMQTWFAKTPAAFGGKYEISQLRREKILAGYQRLKLGMNKSEVQSLLSSPDFEQIYSTFDAHMGNRPVPNPHCGWDWEYYFTKTSENFGEPTDSLLHLSFNSQDKLIWVKPQNIKKLTEKGAPEQ